jgi:hypothetical protein
VQAGGWRAGAAIACAMPALSVLVALLGRDTLAGPEAEPATA